MAIPPLPAPWPPPRPPKPPRDLRRLRAASKSFPLSLFLLGTLTVVVWQLPSDQGTLGDENLKQWKNTSDTATSAAYLALAPMLHVKGDPDLLGVDFAETFNPSKLFGLVLRPAVEDTQDGDDPRHGPGRRPRGGQGRRQADDRGRHQGVRPAQGLPEAGGTARPQPRPQRRCHLRFEREFVQRGKEVRR